MNQVPRQNGPSLFSSALRSSSGSAGASVPAGCGAWIALVAGLGLCLPGVAHGQQDTQRRIERAIRSADPAQRLKIDPSLGLTERSVLDVGGFLSTNYIYLTDSQDNSRRLFQPEVSLYARSVIDNAHTFFGRARFQYRAYSEGDSFDGDGDAWAEPFIDRWWYEFDLRQATAAYEGETLEGNFNARVGRQFVDWGSGLTLSENLYAARLNFEFGRRFSLEGLAGITPMDESVVDFDASYDTYDEDVSRGFFGGLFRYRTRSAREFYTFILHQADFNDDQNPTIAAVGDVNFDYDSTYLGFGATGSFTSTLLYLGEFVYEWGESESDPLRGDQNGEDIAAWSARGQLTQLLTDRGRTRLEFEAIFASGDDDRLTTSDTVGGNLRGTHDTAFNSLGFVNTGLAFAPSLSNIMTFRVGASTFPFPSAEGFEQLQLGIDLFALNKMDPEAPIDEDTSDDRFLGFETDVFANYRITSDLAVTARYGVFFPGAAIQTEKDTRHFVFLGMTLSF
jgi:hypothetical protein